ncbi:Yip1 family protein [Ammoniphilus resinae]|uniref:Threonine/homoserine/homoserine lactone efflux protein n=1 Tax=Ammoniphilus resinae TaxID=861532 RepID=A0ABS4GMD4_9BACL|nr:Yip1 family protein [Ammoniphilus resinae]MBP1931272.1 threonine/homoserine/homoserine lactone efflux protein [Ammoniphilus resinae]
MKGISEQRSIIEFPMQQIRYEKLKTYAPYFLVVSILAAFSPIVYLYVVAFLYYEVNQYTHLLGSFLVITIISYFIVFLCMSYFIYLTLLKRRLDKNPRRRNQQNYLPFNNTLPRRKCTKPKRFQ